VVFATLASFALVQRKAFYTIHQLKKTFAKPACDRNFVREAIRGCLAQAELVRDETPRDEVFMRKTYQKYIPKHVLPDEKG
jgi:hypothetical protein